jgi:tetratricopeptide (TPR) repeat protein
MQLSSTQPSPARAIESQLDVSWTQHVNSAFRNFHSILALSRSPLADSALVMPALVRDARSPTADERGHALRLLLQWAVGLLAPAPPTYPLGADRPYDDPTWRDPRWWRYNILRHRYLEPLHPDEFVEGGRYTETLIAITGIPSSDTFFEERNRAIREIAAWLQQLETDTLPNQALQQMAIEDALRPLQQQPSAHILIDIAATFDDVFPRTLLLQLAQAEHVAGVERALTYLTRQRLLRTDDQGADLWLSPALRAYLSGHQPEEQRQRRHRQAARHYETAGEPFEAAQHWQRAGQWETARRSLFAVAGGMVDELRISELIDALMKFRSTDLAPEQWRETQILIADLSVRHGQREEALTACRRALKATCAPQQQARIYRRMGKLYEQHNQSFALSYYQQAEAHLADADSELVTLLKDRAWLHIVRREWDYAEADLARALAQVSIQDHEARADIFDALASLNRQQQQFEQAGMFARQALALREELGNLPRIADSFQVLGLLYSATNDFTDALAAFDEALVIYRKLDNQERMANVLLNVGMVHHLAGHLSAAMVVYNDCLQIADALDLRLIRVRVRYNLAEACAELDEADAARGYWRTGYDISLAAGFDDEVRRLDVLRDRFPLLHAVSVAPSTDAQAQAVTATPLCAEASHRALVIAHSEGGVTAKALMDATGVSKATATRQLADLVRQGLLHAQGKGRATTYRGN